MTQLFGGSSDARLFSGADVFLDADACEFTSVWSYRVRFSGRERPTRAISYRRAVGENLEYRRDTSEIEALLDPLVGFEWISSYTLTYREVEVNGRVLLERIEEDFGLEPPRSFDYTSSDFDYDRIVRYVPPAEIGREDNLHLRRITSQKTLRRAILDMNGDGFPDPMVADPLWAACVDADANILETFLIEDIFWQPPAADDEASAGIVRVGFNTGGGFGPPEAMVTPMPGLTPPSLRRSLRGIGIGEMFDVNGDGLPDRVRTSSNSSPFQVQLNHAGVREPPLVARLGIGWGSWHATIFRVFAGSPGHLRLDDDRGNRLREIFDWNGDGFPDAVQADVVPWKIHLGGPADGSGVAPALMRCADEGQGTATRVDDGPRNVADPLVTWEVTDLQPFEGSCFPEPDPVEPPLP